MLYELTRDIDTESGPLEAGTPGKVVLLPSGAVIFRPCGAALPARIAWSDVVPVSGRMEGVEANRRHLRLLAPNITPPVVPPVTGALWHTNSDAYIAQTIEALEGPRRPDRFVVACVAIGVVLAALASLSVAGVGLGELVAVVVR